MEYIRARIHGADVLMPDNRTNRETLFRLAVSSSGSICMTTFSKQELFELIRRDVPRHHVLRLQ